MMKFMKKVLLLKDIAKKKREDTIKRLNTLWELLENRVGEKDSTISYTQTILYLKDDIKEYEYNLLDL